MADQLELMEEQQETPSPQDSPPKSEEVKAGMDITHLSDSDLEKLLQEEQAPEIPAATPPEPTAVAEQEQTSAPSTEETEGKKESPPEPAVDISKLQQQLSSSQLMIQRQAAELGMLRKRNPEEFAAKRKAISEKFITGDPVEAMEELQRIQREEEEAYREEERSNGERHIAIALRRIPDLPKLLPELAAVLIEEDGFDQQTALALVSDLSRIGPGAAIYAYGKRAQTRQEIGKLKKENADLKAELDKAKKSVTSFAKGVEQAAKARPVLANSSGVGAAVGAGKIALNKPVSRLSDKELSELAKRLKEGEEIE